MIQRIQTLYLTISSILLILIGFLSLGEIASGDLIYKFTIKGVSNLSDNALVYNGWPLVVLLVIILAIQLLVIFNFKKRIFQMRLATISILLMIGLEIVSWYFIYASQRILGESVYSFKIAMTFPLITAILNYLAIRAIGKDEALIRSVDRIR